MARKIVGQQFVQLFFNYFWNTGIAELLSFVSVIYYFISSRSTDTKIYLEEYFTNSRQALSGDVNKYLCLMCIQCFEVIFII